MYLDDIAAQIRSRIDASDLPDGDTRQLFRLYATLCLAKGDGATAEDVHNLWAAWTAERDPAHDALVPVSKLDRQTVALDEPFARAIREVAADHDRKPRVAETQAG